jgi:3-hydroxyisobutyrate dehydrogenase-like beta-hydroxyacid dehydrogenase
MSESSGGSEVVAIIGAGEMGAAVGRRLMRRGARVRTSLRGRSAESVDRVRRLGLEVFDDDDALIDGAGFLLSIIPPGQAVAVAERFRAPLTRARVKPVFVECNAIAPATVRSIANLLKDTGCKFVDAGIVGGPPPEDGDKGPRIYASGPDAHLFARLGSYGLNIPVLDGEIGTASALKLCYATLSKGSTALGAVAIMAATRENLAEALWKELSSSQPQVLGSLVVRIPDMLPKAHRWVAEMEQIAAFLGGGGETMLSGAAQTYALLAKERRPDGSVSGPIASELLDFVKRKK